MLFRLGDFFHARFPDGRRVPHLHASFFGPTTRPLTYGGEEGRFSFVAVEFQPLVMAALLREELTEFTDRVVGARGFCDRSLIDALMERLLGSSGTESLCAALDRFFTRWLPESVPEPEPGVRRLVAHLRRSRETPSIRRLKEISGMSERTLRRKFTGVTGLSPRLYQAILRAERTFGIIYHNPEARAADIVDACGYSDQAHLIHEVRRFALATPGELRRNRITGPAPLRDFFGPEVI